MARRRINLRFVTILLAVVVGIAGIGLFALRYMSREHPQQYIDAGDQAMADGRYGEAASNYQAAVRLSPHDPKVLVSYGAALDKLAQNAPDLYGDERNAYEDALTVDPNYLPAVKALVDLYALAAVSQVSADVYRDLIDYSRRAHVLDPTNERYAVLPDQTIVNRWISGLLTDQSEVDNALKELSSLQQKYPDNADIPFIIVQAKLFQAGTLTRQSVGNLQPQDATDLYQQCIQIFQQLLGPPDAPPGPQSGNAMLHARYSQLLQRLSIVDQAPDVPREQYAKLAMEEATKARELIKPEDPSYIDVNMYAAQQAAAHGDMDGAIKIYRAMPDTPTVRMNLADLLGRDPKTRGEGEHLLEGILSQTIDITGHLAGLRLDVTESLAGLQISDYAEATDPITRDHLHTHIEDELSKLNSSVTANNTMDVARLQARFQTAEGHYNDVISNLTALTAANPTAAHGYSILMMLAGAYANTHQGPCVLSVLNLITANFPQDVNARKLLVRMMIQEDPADAPAQLAILEKMSPNDPDLNLMHASLLLQDPKNKHSAEVKHYYDLLPEKTPAQIRDKATIAQRGEEWTEATRLLNLLTAQDPKDASSWEQLAGLLTYLGKKDDALAAAQKGLAANPDSDDLKVMIPRIQGADPKLIANLRETLAEKNPDKLQGQLDLAEISSERADLDGEEAHLKMAEKIAPDSPRVWDLLFQFYLSTTRLKDAAGYIDKLGAANYDQCDGALYQFALEVARHNYVEAADVARKLTQDKPELVKSWIALGDVYKAQGQYEQSISEYAIALQKQSTNRSAYAGLVQCSYLLKRPSDALEYIQDGLRRMPDDTQLRDMLIAHELQYGSPTEAINVIRDEITRNPNNPRLYAALGNTYTKAALQENQTNQHDLAVKTLQDSLTMLVQAQAKWPDEPSIYLSLCEAEETAQMLQEAEKTLQTWASRDAWKMRPEPYRRLAEFYDIHGAKDAAEAAMQTAVARSNYRIDLQTDMAKLLMEHKKFNEAIALLRAANADQPIVRQTLVQTLVQAGRMDDAFAQLKTDLKGNPPDASNLLTMWGGILLDRKDYAGAVDRTTLALEMDSTNYRALHLRGRARLLTSPPDPAGALTDLAAARDAAPDDLQIRLDLGSAYLANGRAGDAIVELKSGLKSDPGNKQLRMLLVNVYISSSQPDYNAALSLLQEVDSAPPFSNDPGVLSLEAKILAHQQDLDDAVQKIQQASALAPTNVPLQREKFDLMLLDKQFQNVLDQTAALKLDPAQNWWISMFRGAASHGLGKNTDASTEFGQAMQQAAATGDSASVREVSTRMSKELGIPAAIAALTPLVQDHLQLQLSLAQMHHENNDDAAAVAILDARMDGLDQLSKADQILLLENASSIYQSAQPQPLTDKAYDCLQKMLKLDPDNVGILNNTAMLLADNYSPTRATDGLPYIQKAMDLLTQQGKEDPRLLDTYGWLLVLSGSLQEGIDELNKSIELSQDASTYYHLSDGYLRLQNGDEAVQQAQSGLNILKARTVPEPEDAQLKIQLQNILTQGQAIVKSKPQDENP